MNEMKEKLTRIGRKILTASRNELYVSMRFLDIALSSLGYEMDLSMRTVGTDSVSIRFNPEYLVRLYREDNVLVNRVYLHMLLHCIFGHMFGRGDRDPLLWDMSCDIAVTSVLDSIDSRAVRKVIPDQRQEVYDQLHERLKVLTAEGVYRVLEEDPPDWDREQMIKKYFKLDDHSFWDRMSSEDKDSSDDGGTDSDQDRQDDRDRDQDADHGEDQTPDADQKENNKPEQSERQTAEDTARDRREQEEKQERQKRWQDITSRIRTNMETYSKDAVDLAGSMYDYLRIATRRRYDYRAFLKRFTSLREEVRLDPEGFDYIYYMYGLDHYGNMPLIEPLEYRQSRKIEELAIVIDTSQSCAGDTVRQFLEETFSILCDREAVFSHMNIHIIQCDVQTKSDIVIRSEQDIRRAMDNFRLEGFGGTDFRPAFRYVDELIAKGAFQNLRGMLYFTDGWGLYPENRPGYDCAFIFFEENYNDRQVPPWAVKLILGPDDLNKGGSKL